MANPTNKDAFEEEIAGRKRALGRRYRKNIKIPYDNPGHLDDDSDTYSDNKKKNCVGSFCSKLMGYGGRKRKRKTKRRKLGKKKRGKSRRKTKRRKTKRRKMKRRKKKRTKKR